jgi:hypothetical protein
MFTKPLFGANDSVMQPRGLPDGRLFRRDSFARCRQTRTRYERETERFSTEQQ